MWESAQKIPHRWLPVCPSHCPRETLLTKHRNRMNSGVAAPLAGDRTIFAFLWDKCRRFFPIDADLEGMFYSQGTDNSTIPEQGICFKLPHVEFMWIEKQPSTQAKKQQKDWFCCSNCSSLKSWLYRLHNPLFFLMIILFFHSSWSLY